MHLSVRTLAFLSLACVCEGFVHAPPGLAAATASGVTATAVQNGSWSAASTWNSGRLPAQGDDVVIPAGRTVTYDRNDSLAYRSVTVFGRLQFTTATTTSLSAGLIKIGADARDNSASCNGGHPTAASTAAMLVGVPNAPIPRGVSATISLVPFNGQNTADLPGLVNCGGRLTLHGAALRHPWTKLTVNASQGATSLTVADDITDWRVGDRIIVVGTNNGRGGFSDDPPSYRPGASPYVAPQTEERTIVAISNRTLTLDTALAHSHTSVSGNFPEVANLTRTVTVRSADTSSMAARGHSMYHAYSSGSIGYARFDGLGKEAQIARYPVHLHMVGSSMRGFSVVGAAVTNSGNKFVTVHNSHYILVKDNIGYRGNTSGFFLEDGSETYNVLDHNLAVLAFNGQPAPNEAISYLGGNGFGFWWANGRNTFINNQSAENDKFGYFFQLQGVTRYYNQTYSRETNLVAPMLDQNGVVVPTTINTIPFFKFARNSCHNEHNWCMQVRGGNWTAARPSIIRDMNTWTVHYTTGIRTNGVLIDGLYARNSNYSIDVLPNYYVMGSSDSWSKDIFFKRLDLEGIITVGLGMRSIGRASSTTEGRLINNANLLIPDASGTTVVFNRNTLQDTNDIFKGSGSSSGAVIVNDWYGSGIAAKVVDAGRIPSDGLTYTSDPALGGSSIRVARTTNATPTMPSTVDDLTPATAITSFGALNDGQPVVIASDGSLTIEGVASDNGTVSRVTVNGIAATPIVSDFSRWQVHLTGLSAGPYTLSAYATDAAGNIELNPHTLTLNLTTSGSPPPPPPPAPVPVSVTTASLSGATVGQTYQATLAATGGTPPYTWSLAGGSLPPGLVLAGNGTLSGTPTTAGSYSFSVRATDTSGQQATRSLALAVTNPTTGVTLLASTSANRSNPVALAGRTVAGNLYAFAEVTNASRVEFFLDNPAMSGSPFQTETSAPYDFAGGNTTTANPYDTRRLANGSHTITVRAQMNDGTTRVLTVTFTVAN